MAPSPQKVFMTCSKMFMALLEFHQSYQSVVCEKGCSVHHTFTALPPPTWNYSDLNQIERECRKCHAIQL